MKIKLEDLNDEFYFIKIFILLEFQSFYSMLNLLIFKDLI